MYFMSASVLVGMRTVYLAGVVQSSAILYLANTRWPGLRGLGLLFERGGNEISYCYMRYAARLTELQNLGPVTDYRGKSVSQMAAG